MIYCFDIDGTICSLREDSSYLDAVPFLDTRDKINNLYDEGNTILFMTARGSVSGKDWTLLTAQQLKEWGFKYHELITNKKPHADMFIDDKCMSASEWRQKFLPRKRGFIAGCFDVMHPGYIQSFKEAVQHCDYLIVGLHEDPTIERGSKLKPVLTLSERREILLALKYVDEVITYKTERELYNYLAINSINIRFLGEDYVGKDYTGKDLDQSIIFLPRKHGWSTTKFKKLVYNSMYKHDMIKGELK